MEQPESKFFVVATPKTFEIWEADRKPRITSSKVLTVGRYWGRSDTGRRKKVTAPVELVKYCVESEGVQLLSYPFNRLSTWRLGSALPAQLVNQWNQIRYGGGEGERCLCVNVPRQKAEQLFEAIDALERR